MKHVSTVGIVSSGAFVIFIIGILVAGEQNPPAPAQVSVQPPAAPSPVPAPAPAPDPDRIGPPAIDAPPPSAIPRVPSPEMRPVAPVPAPARKTQFTPFLPTGDYAPPVVYIDQPKFDFGSLYRGEVVDHRFEIENKGKAPLMVTKIRPSCGCTVVNDATRDKVISPGAKGGFELKIETSRQPVGLLSKYADVDTNDPKQPTTRVYIQGKIESILKVDPEAIKLQVVRGKGQGTTEVTLTRNTQAELKVLGARSQSGRLLLDLKEVQPGALWKLLVTTNYSTKETQSYFTEMIQLDIQVADRRMTQDINLTAMVKDRIDLNPRMLYFRRTDFDALRKDGKTPAMKPVDVKAVLEEPYKFAIKEVKLDDPDSYFKVKVDTVKEGREYRLQVSIDKLPETTAKDQAQKSLKGNITIITDDPEMPPIELRCVAFF